MTCKWWLRFLLSAAVISSYGAKAADWYAGGAIGHVRTSVDTGGMDAAVRASGGAGSATTAGDTSTGWKLFAGYAFNDKLALEAHYTDLGRIKTDTRTTALGSVAGQYDTSALGLDVVVTMATATRFDLFGKLGYYRAEVDGRAPVVSGGVLTTTGVSANNSGLKLGIGGRFHMNDKVAIRLEWDHFNDVGDARTTGGNYYNLFSLGVQVRF